jgi:hypothetical protein
LLQAIQHHLAQHGSIRALGAATGRRGIAIAQLLQAHPHHAAHTIAQHGLITLHLDAQFALSSCIRARQGPDKHPAASLGHLRSLRPGIALPGSLVLLDFVVLLVTGLLALGRLAFHSAAFYAAGRRAAITRRRWHRPLRLLWQLGLQDALQAIEAAIQFLQTAL